MASLMDTRRRIMLNTPHLETLTDSLVTFDTDVPADLKGHKLYIEPIQDLHGYDHPWPAGGGVNKYDISGLTSETRNGVTVVANADGTLTVTGTPTATADIYLPYFTSAVSGETYILNGAPSGGSSKWKLDVRSNEIYYGDSGNGVSFEADDSGRIQVRIVIYVAAGSNLNIIFKPMIRLSSVPDSTFAPYSNICPISGRTGVEVVRCGKNIFSQSTFENATWATRFPAMENALNDLPAGTYKISYTSTVTSVKDTFTSETELAATAGMNILYNEKRMGAARDNITRAQALAHYSVDKSFTFTISSEDVGKITKVYMYGLGRDGAAEGAPNGILGAATYSNIQIEQGSTATPYEPYQAESYDIDFPSEAGTVYGGTLDVKTGELVVDRMFWADNTANMDNDEEYPGWKNAGVRNIVGANLNKSIEAIGNIGTMLGIKTTQNHDIVFLSSRYYDDKKQSEWIALAQDVQFAIPLATPITYQLTPHTLKALRGVNNIWSDESTNTQVRFWTHKKED